MEDEPLPSPPQLVLMAVAVEGGLGLLAVGLGAWLERPPWAMIRWNWEGAAWGLAGGLPLVAGLLALVRLPLRPLVKLVRIVDELVVPLFRECRVVELAIIAAMAGLGEEMLFRGVVQATIAEWFGGGAGNWVGIVAAALLFGLLHPITTSYAVIAGVIGVYLGWLFAATDNLLAPIVAHGLYDFIALVYLVRWRGKSSDAYHD
ncbi:MAG: CPBP family intramembrane metalloprotease [Pirellulales bacterium]|nr:CPBP family intramembrane metalloprotease [Pirellulales bacterium]